MKSLLLAFALVLISAIALHAGWTTDYQAALADAKAQKKLVLLDFTGKDWCAPCKLLEKDVFEKQAFKDLADKKFILVTLDFPEGTPLSPELTKQNSDLNDQFTIQGFPTLLAVDPDTGKEVGRIEGYRPELGAEPVLTRLRSFPKK
jgi:thioredoxin-related protein